MSDEKALVPVEQKEVGFYGDTIIAVRMKDGPVYVPVRPICDLMGIDWSSQRQRIMRDPVLSAELRPCVVVTTTQGQPDQRREMAALPLDFISGFLFGINANRVNPDIREHLLRYQRECYRVLAQAFTSGAASDANTPTLAALAQVREMGLAIVRMAEEQMEFERRLATSEGRLNHAAVVVGDLTRRVTSLEQKLTPATVVTEEQASQIGQAVKAVAIALSKKSGRNEFGGVYGELYRKFGITGYKMLPARRFEEAMRFLTEWYQTITGDDLPF